MGHTGLLCVILNGRHRKASGLRLRYSSGVVVVCRTACLPHCHRDRTYKRYLRSGCHLIQFFDVGEPQAIRFVTEFIGFRHRVSSRR